jgi:hypothetical protein
MARAAPSQPAFSGLNQWSMTREPQYLCAAELPVVMSSMRTVQSRVLGV